MTFAIDPLFTTNGVHFLRTVLPPLIRVTRLLESKLDDSEQDLRNFLRYFDVYTRLLLYGLDRVNQTKEPPGLHQSAHLVLARLDGAVNADIHRLYPRTTVINTWIACSEVAVEPVYPKLRILTQTLLATRLEELEPAELRYHVAFKTTEERDRLLDAVKNLSDAIELSYPEDFVLQEDFQPQKKRRKEPPYDIGPVASSLYQALSSRTTCSCVDLHDYAARIGVATYRGCADNRQKFDFDLIFCLNQPQICWQETHVRANLAQFPKKHPKVHFDLEEPIRSTRQMTSKRNAPPRQRIKEICKPLRIALSSKLNCLNLELEDGELYKIQSTKTRFTSDELTNAVSLGQLISSGTMGLGEKVKRVLAVLLAYAVLHHYGGSWLGPSWGRDNVFFMKSAAAIALRPYIFTRVERTAQLQPVALLEDSDLDDLDPDEIPIHPYPDLVTLGTILLEIYEAKPIEALAAHFGIVEEENINAKWFVADEVYGKIRGDLPDNYREAVNACLDPNFGSSADDSDRAEQEIEDFRRQIYMEVVKPLEDELDQGFGKSVSIDDLDIAAETMDLSSWGQTFERRVPTQVEVSPLAPLQLQKSQVNVSLHHPKHSYDERQLSEPEGLVASQFEFFDDWSGPDNLSNHSCKSSDTWLKATRSTYERLLAEPNTPERVKIAVLDTGIDLSHLDMDTERIQSVRSWVRGKNGEEEDRSTGDASGHGTHTAGILLDLSPNADIYVAQIATNEPSSPSQIAKACLPTFQFMLKHLAVTYATTVWQVDIISMSFGFQTRVPGYKDLEKAIRDAEYANILIFAAASNSGGNRTRAYPARDDKVICIHSCDAYGNPSGFNPDPIPDQYNFSTLGEAVCSSWPVGLCDLEKHPEAMVYKSGTSFATPIAAATAAFLLAYARQKLSEDEAKMLQRTAGMRAVLNLISKRRKEFTYVALNLTPDSFFGKGENFIKEALKQAIFNSGNYVESHSMNNFFHLLMFTKYHSISK